MAHTQTPLAAVQAPRGLSYCFVRLRASFLGRTTSVKYLFTETTLMSEFVSTVSKHGTIKQVEFPSPQQPITQEELETAREEGRLL